MVLVEMRERRATAYLSALISAGHEVDLWAALEESRAGFDEALCADPIPRTPMDLEQFELRKALGVG